jgi:hypothetical protein
LAEIKRAGAPKTVETGDAVLTARHDKRRDTDTKKNIFLPL